MRRKNIIWFFVGFFTGAAAIVLGLWLSVGVRPFAPHPSQTVGERPRPEAPGPTPDPYPLTRPYEPPAEADRAEPER
jgi:hypothetical protein